MKAPRVCARRTALRRDHDQALPAPSAAFPRRAVSPDERCRAERAEAGKRAAGRRKRREPSDPDDRRSSSPPRSAGRGCSPGQGGRRPSESQRCGSALHGRVGPRCARRGETRGKGAARPAPKHRRRIRDRRLQAIFSWAELFLSPLGDGAIVVFERDGAPLPASEGPLAIVSLNDTQPGPRHVKWLERIEIRRVAD